MEKTTNTHTTTTNPTSPKKESNLSANEQHNIAMRGAATGWMPHSH